MFKCDICGSTEFKKHYEGRIRAGNVGSHTLGVVYKCLNCRIVRLGEKHCISPDSYNNSHYRDSLNQTTDLDDYENTHKQMHLHLQDLLPKLGVDFDNKIVIDLGCGGGSFLKPFKQKAMKTFGIELDDNFRKQINLRGDTCYSSVNDYLTNETNRADIVITNQVIEHVVNPKEFLLEASKLLSEGGILIVTTPNLNDILNLVCGDQFWEHFYRTQHRWYFDLVTLSKILSDCGFTVKVSETYHRYEINNFINWIQANKSAKTELDFTAEQEKRWKNFLVEHDLGDNLVVVAKKL